MTFTEISEHVRYNGGFTYSVSRHTSPSTGYAVALSKTSERTVPLAEFSPVSIIKYVHDFAKELSRAGAHFGAWIWENTVYLDCAIVVDSEDLAIDLARQSEQIAIYDFAAKTSVPVVHLK